MKFSRLYDIDLERAVDINLEALTSVIPVPNDVDDRAALVLLFLQGQEGIRIWVAEHEEARPLEHNLDLFWELAHANLVEGPTHF